MAASFGRGAMTNHWRDFKNSDVILVIGANPAENHPCGWKWAYVARDQRGAQIIHVDPRFTRTSAIADIYAPIRAGADVAFFGGLINYVLENKLYHEDYVKLHTNAAFIVASGYQFNDGLFSGYDEAKRTYDPKTWDYDRLPPGRQAPGGRHSGGGQPSVGRAFALGARPVPGRVGPRRRPPPRTPPPAPVAYAKTDPTLQDPRCVFQLMKAHYARYTPEKVSEITGMPVGEVQQDRRALRRHRHRRQGRQHRLRRRPHPPHLGGADHPRRRPRPDAARQRRPSRRRCERRTGPRQHPGQHRQRHLLGDPPRLPRHPPSPA